MSMGEASCGFCLNELAVSDEVKELPCCHQFCTECLVTALKKYGQVECPYCRSCFGMVDIESLQTVLSTEITTGILVNCDRDDCYNKARAYCKTCRQLFCGQDLEVHDKILKHGAPLSIPVYQAMQQKYGRRLCRRHRSSIVLACAQCYSVFCNDCLDETSTCNEANRHPYKHDVRSLRKFSDSLLTKLETRMSEVRVHNISTDNCIKLAQQKSDEEEERSRDLLEKFRSNKNQYVRQFKTYLENVDQRIVQRMEALRNERAEYERSRHRRKSEAGQKLEGCSQVITQHIADIVSSYEGTEREMSEYANGQIPPFVLKQTTISKPETTNNQFKGPVLVITETRISPPK